MEANVDLAKAAGYPAGEASYAISKALFRCTAAICDRLDALNTISRIRAEGNERIAEREDFAKPIKPPPPPKPRP